MESQKKSLDMPVSKRHLDETRAELKYDFASVQISLRELANNNNNRFDQIDRRLEANDEKFKSIDRRFEIIDQRFDAIDRRFEAIDRRFEAIDLRFDAIEKRLDRLEAGMADLKISMSNLEAKVHRVLALVEEQNIKNNYVLDGYATLQLRQDEFEKKTNERIEQKFNQIIDLLKNR